MAGTFSLYNFVSHVRDIASAALEIEIAYSYAGGRVCSARPSFASLGCVRACAADLARRAGGISAAPFYGTVALLWLAVVIVLFVYGGKRLSRQAATPETAIDARTYEPSIRAYPIHKRLCHPSKTFIAVERQPKPTAVFKRCKAMHKTAKAANCV